MTASTQVNKLTRCDQKYVIAVHVMSKDHTINWEEASVKSLEKGYWKRRVLELSYQNPVTAEHDEPGLRLDTE